MTASEIRSAFLDFFKSKGHIIVPSAPIVIKNDPTLLFTNAGMNQFKDYFLGNKLPEVTRVADTQKCLRVSGKHNDLEEVGVDTYHHTMFEMLGNWSFGDYFKQEAIAWSWELLTEVFRIDKDRIYVSVFEGDEKESLPFDQEAYDEWKKWIAEDRILKGNKKDNFWEMGDVGPCGPCSEIHIDCRSNEEREQTDGATLVNADHPQVIEVWNNVFMQFNRLKDGSLQPLPATHVDTGMGFERLVRVLQGKSSNYDTDLFTGTIALVEKITGKQYDFGDSRKAVAFRVLADHVRAIAFTISDGQLPANTGAGYVIRRILRRAVRYYYSYLDYKLPLLHQLIAHIATQFESVFPDLYQQKAFVERVVKEEEDAFLRTLEKGLSRMDELMSAATEKKIKGRDAFELNDTYGFPLDLTRLIAGEHGFEVDEAGFEVEMKQQKDRSRAATAVDTGDWTIVHPTENNVFVGYHDFNIETQLVRYRRVKAKGKEQYQLVLAATPFYAESGGQVGDKGVLLFGDEEIHITDTRKENNLIIHFADKLPADTKLPVVAKIDWHTRMLTSYNHTATHLLHAALRQVLGTHVAQKGSLVGSDVLRFDFSHFAKLTEEEVHQVSALVNEKIRANIPVIIKELPKAEAIAMGAMALFGEKYGDTVRTVIIDPEYSIELCGGTHVGFTGMIGVFTVVAESAVAAGVRRLEALTGPEAIRYFTDKVAQHKKVAELLKAKDPLKAVEKLIDDKHALEKRLESLEARQLVDLRKDLLKKTKLRSVVTEAGEHLDIDFIGAIVEVGSMDALKKLCFEFKHTLDNYVVVMCAEIDGKANVAIGISDMVVTKVKMDAGKMIKEIVAPIIKGGGGGQKNLATAGGQDASQLQEVISKVSNLFS